MPDVPVRPADLSVRLAGPADQPLLERLWLMFSHDMSEFHGRLPAPDGTFRSDRLRMAFSEPGWVPYLAMSGGSPVAFAFVRGLTGPIAVLNSFFVVRGARGAGVGSRTVHEVVARHPGPWEVAFQDANTAAVRFWRRVAAKIAGDAWAEERRAVPGRPELPPDTWISFTVPARTAGRR